MKETCNTCGHLANKPWRNHNPNTGEIVHGCIDQIHSGILKGKDLSWHIRPVAVARRRVERIRIKNGV